jgi:hypothetical protein
MEYVTTLEESPLLSTTLPKKGIQQKIRIHLDGVRLWSVLIKFTQLLHFAEDYPLHH